MIVKKATVAVLSLVLALGLSLGTPKRAIAQSASQEASAQEAARFVERLENQALRILAANARTTSRQQQAALRTLIRAEFNMRSTGQFVLGQYWARCSPEQRAEFLKLFKIHLMNNYLQHLGTRNAISLIVVDSRRVGEKDVLVETRVETVEGTADTVWRVRANNNRYRVIDVSVNGVSLALTQRRKFASIVSRKGVEGLLKMLRDKLSVQAGSTVRTNQPKGSLAVLFNSLLASPNANRVLLVKK